MEAATKSPKAPKAPKTNLERAMDILLRASGALLPLARDEEAFADEDATMNSKKLFYAVVNAICRMHHLVELYKVHKAAGDEYRTKLIIGLIYEWNPMQAFELHMQRREAEALKVAAKREADAKVQQEVVGILVERTMRMSLDELIAMKREQLEASKAREAERGSGSPEARLAS
jgi:ribulose 1,5-bisphosphate synthetase/thiazole synthase